MLQEGRRRDAVDDDGDDDEYYERVLLHMAPTQLERNAVSEPSMASAVLPLDFSLPGTPVLRMSPLVDARRPAAPLSEEKKPSASARQKDVSKRRGVKLNVDDIKAVTFDQ